MSLSKVLFGSLLAATGVLVAGSFAFAYYHYHKSSDPLPSASETTMTMETAPDEVVMTLPLPSDDVPPTSA